MNEFTSHPGYKQFYNQHILAVDYGEKVTGLATYKVGSDPYPVPYEKLIFKSQSRLIDEIIGVIDNEVIDILVVGVPYLLDGQSTSMTKKIQLFIKQCESRITNTQIFEQDETLSSFEAEKRMLNSPLYNFKVDPKRIDSLAASIILEDFIKTGVNLKK